MYTQAFPAGAMPWPMALQILWGLFRDSTRVTAEIWGNQTPKLEDQNAIETSAIWASQVYLN